MTGTERASGVSRRARRTRFGAAAAIAAAGVLGVALSHDARATLPGTGSSSERGKPAAHGRHTRHAFEIRGLVGGLYPGASAQLTLTVTNPFHFPIVVTSITTAVGSPAPGCAASNLTVGAFAGRLPVPALGSTHVAVPVTLAHAAPDACQGVVFPLHYSGLARKQ